MMKKITLMLTMIFSLVLTNTFAQGSCATAVPLTPGTQQCGDTSSGADVYDDNTCLGSYDGGDDYIFSYVATATGETLTLDLTGVAGWTGFAMSDDCPDAGTYNCMGSATTTSAGDINFTSDPLTSGVTYYIHISTWPTPQSTAFCLDAVVNPAPSCLDPDTFAASNVTTNTVDLSWNDPSGVQFDFEYVVQASGVGTPAGSGVAVGATSATGISTELDTTPLAANTAYEAWVRADCGGGDYSAWVGPIYFNTACNTFTVPFTEGFNSASTSESCWTVLNENGDGDSWNTSYATNPYEGDEAAMMYTDFNSGANDDWLISPTITLTGNQRLKFHYRVQSAGEPNDFELLLSTTGTAPASFTNTLIANTSYDNITYAEQIVDLSAYSGDVNIAWHVPNGGLDGWRLYIDNVIVEDLPSCIEPDTFVASNVTSSTVDLSWNDPSGVQFDFEYVVQASGVGTPAGSGVAVGATSATGISAELDTTPLAANTAYEAWVRADCGGGDYSAWVGPIYFTTLCDALVAPFLESFETPALPACWTEGGDNVWEYGSLGGGTPAPNFADYGANGVADHSVSGTGTFIGMDGSNNGDGDVSILTSPMIDISGLTTPYLSYYVFSNNEDDAAQNELMVEFYDGSAWTTVETIQANLGADWVMYGVDLTTFTITGDVQARFTVTGVANGGSTYYNDILIDDVSIDEAPTCFAPTGLAVSNVTTNSADLTWTDGSGGVQFDFYYVIQPQGTGTAGITVENYYDYSSGVPFTATCTDISDCANTLLTPNTAYEVYVRDDCGGAWVGPVNFTTACDAIVTFPFTETFEDASASRDCWSNIQEVGSADWTYNTGSSGGAVTTAYSGTLNARFVSSGGGEVTKLVSPTLDLTSLTTPRLKFYYAQEFWSPDQNELKVYYRVSSSDSWVEIGYYTADIAAWTEVILTLPNPSATYQIAFEGINNWGRANVVDDVTVEETPACPEPTGLTVMNITDTTADFSWTATTGNYEYVLDTNAADPAGSGTAIAGETYNATGLTPETTYYFHVRSDCGSTWTTISFTTPATPPANDDCANAIQVSCGGTYTGDTSVGATDSGSNASADVWYYYDGAAGDITASLCTNTSYDSMIRVFDACGGTELTSNDDFCGVQSEVTFTADGTSTYYIMVEGFSSNEGAFELNVSCVLSANSFDSNSFVAYPNPVKNVLTLEYSNEISSVSVYNMLGQEVLSRTIDATSTQIDMSQLNAGTYLVNVTSGDIQKTIKVVKQ